VKDLDREMSVNSTANVHDVRPTKTSRKLQLWTTQSKTKYAIRFENDLCYLARTDPGVVQYTTVIAESDTTFKGYEYDWKFILNRWTASHKFASGFKNRAGFLFAHSEDIPIKKNTSSSKKLSKSSFHVTTLDGIKYSVKSKSYIKCHFCKLLFNTKNRRKVHEIAWHSKNSK
jgi:hypothetical protein